MMSKQRKRKIFSPNFLSKKPEIHSLTRPSKQAPTEMTETTTTSILLELQSQKASKKPLTDSASMQTLQTSIHSTIMAMEKISMLGVRLWITKTTTSVLGKWKSKKALKSARSANSRPTILTTLRTTSMKCWSEVSWRSNLNETWAGGLLH